MPFFKFFKNTSSANKESKEDQGLRAYIKKTTGFDPKDLLQYKISLTHQSYSDRYELPYNNERLEFLGDSVIDMVVSEFLYSLYPDKNEGDLTRIRSTIVNRKSLNKLAQKIGLDQKLRTIVNLNLPGVSLPGNALEAFIGAIYVDQGYHVVNTFIIKKLIETHLNLDTIETEYENYKSTLLEWSQKESKKLSFKVEQETNSEKPHISFLAQALIDGELFGKDSGRTKKIAEQNASLKALLKLNLKQS